MCEERSKKIKKGSQVKRLREARRQNRLPRPRVPSTSDNEETLPAPMIAPLSLAHQEFIYYDLTMRTAALMQKSQEIQNKICALKRETAEFVASVMNNPTHTSLQLMQLKFYSNLSASEVRTRCAQAAETQRQENLQQTSRREENNEQMDIQQSGPVIVKQEPLSPKT